MKRLLITMIALATVTVCGSTSLHAQKVYTNGKPMGFWYDLKIYYAAHKVDLTSAVEAVPEDKFFAVPPGCTEETCKGEQASIGAEVAHAADAQYRMCTIMVTGKTPPASTLPGTMVMKSSMPTKAAMLDALKKSFDVCEPLVVYFKDSDISKMVDSQHALQPYASTLFNVISHDREVWGRILSYMAAEGIKAGEGQNAHDYTNPDDLYYCGGTASKTMENCTYR